MSDRRMLAALAVIALLAGDAAAAAPIEWVLIDDPGNAPDDPTPPPSPPDAPPVDNCVAGACGAVPYAFWISKYEVTNAQYAEFLNAKAASDPLALYGANMGRPPEGGIARSGSAGSYAYAARPGFEDKPLVSVSFYNAMRFANWLHNGRGDGDTETGAYTLLGGPATTNGRTVERNPGATHFVPSDAEWYKAAFYDPTTGTYYDYPAGSDLQTACTPPGATPNTANCIQFPSQSLTAVGSYSGSPSPFGTFDQGGNVWEWTEQIVADGRVARGGAWNSGANTLPATAWLGVANPNTQVSNLGFRVASLVPEPAQGAGAAAAAALALLARCRARA